MDNKPLEKNDGKFAYEEKKICIWKYTLLLDDVTTIKVPINSKIISIKSQKNNIRIWVLFDLKNLENLEKRTFEVFVTGQFFRPCYKNNFLREYRETVEIINNFNNSFVFHVFEIIKKENENE